MGRLRFISIAKVAAASGGGEVGGVRVSGRDVRPHWRAGLLASVVLAAGCSSAGGASSSTTHEPPTTSTAAASSTVSPEVVARLKELTATAALGDSVPYGTACDCSPYPQLVGADIARVAGHAVETSNDAVPGYQTADVVAQLAHDRRVIHSLRNSHAVTVEVGANDVAYSSACATDVACYDQKLPQITSNLTAIVTRIHQLAAGSPVVLLDYWSVWLGGEYATAQGQAYVDAATAVTTSVNDTISAVARATGSTYVDLRTAFRGPDDAWDETHLLASDGEHPNAAGHVRIAEAVAQTVTASA